MSDDDRNEDGSAADGATGSTDIGALPAVGDENYPTYAMLFDDSGAIRVSIPTAWADIDTGAADPGTAVIAASTDVERALEEFDVPGALIQVTPGPLTDADTALGAAVDPTDCTIAGSGDYDDGLYAGRFQQLVDCGDGDSTIWVVVAAPEDNSFSVLVSIQALDRRDESAARQVLDSFLIEPRAVPGL
jgi:hypothetical protein